MLCVSAVVAAVVAAGAQERSPAPAANDPRVGLKAGLKDAGVAARNMELVANLPKPPGFFDPKEPAGHRDRTGEARNEAGREAGDLREARGGETGGARSRRPLRPTPRSRRSSAAAAWTSPTPTWRSAATNLFVGNFSGFNIYDISRPDRDEAGDLGRLPWRPGGPFDSRQPADHVGRADPWPDRLRHLRRRGPGERRALPRRPDLRHHRRQEAAGSLPRSRPAAARTRTRCSRIPTTRRTSTSTGPAPARRVRPRNSPAAPTRSRKKIPIPPTTASTSSRSRWPPPRGAHRQPAADLLGSGDRRHRRPRQEG